MSTSRVRRSELAVTVAQLVGGPLTIEDAGNGWPALGTVDSDGTTLSVALFVGPIGLAHRPQRVGVERRFQNPAANDDERDRLGWHGRPIAVPAGRTPLLLGIWSEDPHLDVTRPVLVSADARKREGLSTRYSVFQRPAALQQAARDGWAEAMNDDGEPMYYFDPRLLPAVALAVEAAVPVPSHEISIAVGAAGLTDGAGGPPEMALTGAAERARRTATALVRDARFSAAVVGAYGGRCAMCGLGLRLVQGAHIYPASAPGSVDEAWNGLCLCSNHHAAFDRHLVWVDPTDRSIRLHPDVLDDADNPATTAFISSTRAVVAEPDATAHRPPDEVFERRYEHFTGRYDWAAPAAGG